MAMSKKKILRTSIGSIFITPSYIISIHQTGYTTVWKLKKSLKITENGDIS